MRGVASLWLPHKSRPLRTLGYAGHMLSKAQKLQDSRADIAPRDACTYKIKCSSYILGLFRALESALLKIEHAQTYHEFLVEVRPEHVVDELLLFVPVFCAAGLVLEDNVVIPSALHCEVVLVQQRVAARYVDLALFLFFGCAFAFFLGLGFSALLLDLLEFAHQRGGLVLFVVVTDWY